MRVTFLRAASTVAVGAAVCSSVAATPAAADGAATIATLPAVVYDAHRGGGMEARENSLSGLQHAFDTGAVQVLDVDTRVLRDGTVVVMHDATVDRASTSSGLVRDFTWSGWAGVRLDLGSWLRPVPAPEPAPTLAQVLDRFGGRIVMTLEVKDPQSLDAVATMVKARGLRESVFLNSNRLRIARRVHALGLHSHLWRSAWQMRSDDPSDFVGFVDVLDADIDAAPADFRRFARSGVRRVWAHTITTRSEADRARALGANGLITDDPRYLTGRTNTYPLVPTRVRVLRSPGTTQVSDAATAQLAVTGESGPGIPGIYPSVSGRGVTASGRPTSARGITTLRLSTLGAAAGNGSVTVRVAAGHAGERRWAGGEVGLRLPLAREDLQLRPSVASSGRRVRVHVRLLDSAASPYTGPRHETGARRTVAGLARARLRLVVSRHGRVVHRDAFRGSDTGAHDGVGTVTRSWTAPRRGRYAVRVEQRGTTYSPVTAVRKLHVR